MNCIQVGTVCTQFISFWLMCNTHVLQGQCRAKHFCSTQYMSIVTFTFYAIGVIFSSRAIVCHKFGQDTLIWYLWCSIFVHCECDHWPLTLKINIGNILSWAICEPFWSALSLLCSHAYFHFYPLWTVNWPCKSLGYNVKMCRTNTLVHGTNTVSALQPVAWE